MCAAMAASFTSATGVAGSRTGVAAWIRPPKTLRDMCTPRESCAPSPSADANAALCSGEATCAIVKTYRLSRGESMDTDLAVTFTGLRFQNPFLLSSAPPTESDANIMRAFDAGWGGVVTKTIGLHPVVNIDGPKTKFLRATPDSAYLSMRKRPGTALHSSWNWELISDKPLDWWVPRIARIKRAHPTRILVASIMAGSGSDDELRKWQTLASACQDQGADALELNLSCPHMDRKDMGS